MGFLDSSDPQHTQFIDLVRGRIYGHHAFYAEARVSNDLWEETIHRSLEALGVPHVWTHGSHEVGTDIALLDENGDRKTTISVKSGTYSRTNQTLKFSGSRLGSHSASIQEMHHKIVSTQSDYYLFAAQPTGRGADAPPKDHNNYSLFLIPKRLVSYGRADQWVPEGRNWVYTSPTLKAEIRASMSYQLWTTLQLRPEGAVPIFPFEEISTAKQVNRS